MKKQVPSYKDGCPERTLAPDIVIHKHTLRVKSDPNGIGPCGVLTAEVPQVHRNGLPFPATPGNRMTRLGNGLRPLRRLRRQQRPPSQLPRVFPAAPLASGLTRGTLRAAGEHTRDIGTSVFPKRQAMSVELGLSNYRATTTLHYYNDRVRAQVLSCKDGCPVRALAAAPQPQLIKR